MNVIADTGPVIALAKVGRLKLIQEIFGGIYIPNAVFRELIAQMGDESSEIDEGFQKFIGVDDQQVNFPEKLIEPIQHLGKGEQDAILLVYQNLPDALLIIDDKAGRNAAKALEIPITGSVGVIIIAKQKGLIANAGELLMAMRERGYWLSDRIIRTAKKQAGE